MSSSTSQDRRIRRRMQLRLDTALGERLEACAARSGLSVAAVVQQILGEALTEDCRTLAEVLKRRRDGDELLALATLWAAEETLRAVVDANPYVRKNANRNRPEALIDAEERLEELRRNLGRDA